MESFCSFHPRAFDFIYWHVYHIVIAKENGAHTARNAKCLASIPARRSACHHNSTTRRNAIYRRHMGVKAFNYVIMPESIQQQPLEALWPLVGIPANDLVCITFTVHRTPCAIREREAVMLPKLKALATLLAQVVI
jgi:hypothetical protein